MDDLLDIVWFSIVAGVQYGKDLLDSLLSPLNTLGPVVAISVIAAMTVGLTTILSKKVKTKRYMQLQKEFTHWFTLRQEALNCEDRDKAERLARNIDQAKLNRVYYDYFFEGFMLSLATKFLPVMTVLAYINESYRPDNLLALFGRKYVFAIGSHGSNPILVSSVFWFILSLMVIYLARSMVKRTYRRYVKPQKPFSSTAATSLPG